MRFYTQDECEQWLQGRQRLKPDATLGLETERFDYPKEPHHMYWMAHWIAAHLTFRQPVLLWITEWGIWPSSENWHLYYSLRQKNGDHRLLHEAPGHVFLEYEVEELASFLQIAMLNGWGGYVLSHANYVNAFFSHDEYVDFFGNLAEVRSEFKTALRP